MVSSVFLCTSWLNFNLLYFLPLIIFWILLPPFVDRELLLRLFTGLSPFSHRCIFSELSRFLPLVLGNIVDSVCLGIDRSVASVIWLLCPWL